MNYAAQDRICELEDRLDETTEEMNDLVKTNEKLIAALEECWEYFDQRSDADCEDGRFIANKEMQMLMLVEEALSATRHKTK